MRKAARKQLTHFIADISYIQYIHIRSSLFRFLLLTHMRIAHTLRYLSHQRRLSIVKFND